MGSGAQDERHERFLREAEDKVADLKRVIAVKKGELEVLNGELTEATQALAQMRAIDAKRD